MINQTISHYKIIAKLGEGGMGLVYKAFDMKLKRNVALKLLPRNLTTDEELKKRFIKEAVAASSFEDKNICIIHEIDETDDGQLFIVMGYYEGETLKERLEKGPLDVDAALDITIQTTEGLSAVHKKKIIHRDIKPANLIITKDGIVKILDFGIAKLKDRTRLTKVGGTLGTASYMSPEQASGKEIDHRTDIWAVGIVLYEMLTSAPPFRGDYEQAVIYSILNETPEKVRAINPDVPEELERIVVKLLEKNRDARYSDFKALLIDLKKLKEKLKNNGQTLPDQKQKKHKQRHIKSKKKAIVVSSIIFFVIILVTVLLFKFKTIPENSALVPNRVVVSSFENLTGDSKLDIIGYIAADWITECLSSLEEIEVIPTLAVMEAMEMMKSEGGSVGKNQINLARTTESSLIIYGSYYLEEKELVVKASLTDIRKNKLLDVFEPERGSKSKPTEIINLLSQKIMGAVAARFSSLDGFAFYKKPPNYDAYCEFIEGKRAFGDNYALSIQSFEKALQLDPEFLMPKLWLSFAYDNMTRYEEANKLREELNQKRDQLSTFERTVLDWGGLMSRGNFLEALRVIQKVQNISPSSNTINYITMLTAYLANRPEEAIHHYNSLNPKAINYSIWTTSWRYNILCSAYYMLDRHKEELETAELALRYFPESKAIWNAKVRSLIALKRLDAMEIALNEVSAVKLRFGSANEVVMEAAIELRIQGYTERAEKLALDVIKYHENMESLSPDDSLYYIDALSIGNQRWENIEPKIKKIVAKHPDDIQCEGILGVVYAHLGKKEKALEISHRLKNMKNPFLNGYASYWKARIAAVLGDKDQAVKLLAQAFSEGMGHGAWQMREIDFLPLRGYQPFEEIIRPAG
jgi:serine/threonine protein kinase